MPTILASAQGDRQAAAEAFVRIVDYPLLIEKAATLAARRFRLLAPLAVLLALVALTLAPSIIGIR